MTNRAPPAPRLALPPGLASRAWRSECLTDEKAQIPVGYTYFGQLIAHDLGHSVPLDEVPHVGVQNPRRRGGETKKTYNLIENPLTLETLYGPGPVNLTHVFDFKTHLFRVASHSIVSLRLSSDASVRAICDTRNRDTTILHRLTVLWMKFHNYIHRELMEARGISASAARGSRKRELYTDTRAHVVAVWHHLIRTEFMPRFIHPSAAALDLSGLREMSEATLLHGVMRAFHALPRACYDFNGKPRNINQIMPRGLDHDEEKMSGWGLSWPLFFDDAAGGTKTAITPSFTPDMRVHRFDLSDKDLQAATRNGPERFEDLGVQAAVGLLAGQGYRITPESLAERFKDGRLALTADAVRRCPLFFVLMLEAQHEGRAGGFGPLGGLLLRHGLESAMDRIDMPPGPAEPLTRPGRMLDLIEYVQEKERNENA